MGWFDRKQKPAERASDPEREGSPPAAGSAEPPAARPIRGFDSFGRALEIPREAYFAQLARPALERAGDDAAALAALLRELLGEGFGAELLPWSEKLVALAGDAQALAFHGVALLQAEDLPAADEVLARVTGVGVWPASARHAEARICERRGDPAGAEAKLREALAADPDHLAAFMALLGALERRGGVEARNAFLHEAHERRAGWRASLLLARERFESKDDEAALALVRGLVEARPDASEALAAALSELVRHGRLAQGHDLAAARFDLARHGPLAGLDLVRCCIAAGDFARGRELLHRIALLPRPDLAATLDEATLALERAERERRPEPVATRPGVGLVLLQEPLFLQGLPGAGWLVPAKVRGARTVAFAPWGTGAGESRFGRGAAALLAEQVWLHTPHRGALAVPVIPGVGIAVGTEPLSPAQIAQTWPREQLGALIVVGARHSTEEALEVVELEFLDAGAGMVLARRRASAPRGAFDELLCAVDREVRAALQPGVQADAIALGAPAAPGRQVEALSCALSLVLAGPEGPLHGVLTGERVLLRRMLVQCEAAPAVAALDALFASILALRARHGSDVADEFARPLAEWFARARDGSVRSLVAVAPLRALRLSAVWRSRRDRILGAAPPAAREWVERVEGVRS